MEALAIADAQGGGRPLVTAIRLILVDDLVHGRKEEEAMVEALWELVPGDLLERVLLFLPSRCQARLQPVCKRWWQLMSSAEFREQTSRIAFRRGYPTCMVQLGSAPGGEVIKKRHKVREVDVPHLPFHFEGPMVYRGGPAEATVEACWPVFALARFDDMYRPKELRFRRLRSDNSWEDLTRIEMAAGGKTVWDVWLGQSAPHMFFRVRPVARTLLDRGADSLGAGTRVQFGVYALVVLLALAVMVEIALSQMLWGGTV